MLPKDFDHSIADRMNVNQTAIRLEQASNFLKGMKPSTRQRFVSQRFDFPAAAPEEAILIGETGCSKDVAQKIVAIGQQLRALKDVDLEEVASTRLLVYAASDLLNLLFFYRVRDDARTLVLSSFCSCGRGGIRGSSALTTKKPPGTTTPLTHGRLVAADQPGRRRAHRGDLRARPRQSRPTKGGERNRAHRRARARDVRAAPSG